MHTLDLEEYRKRFNVLTWEFITQTEPFHGPMARAKVSGGWLYRQGLWNPDQTEIIASCLVFVPEAGVEP